MSDCVELLETLPNHGATNTTMARIAPSPKAPKQEITPLSGVIEKITSLRSSSSKDSKFSELITTKLGLERKEEEKEEEKEATDQKPKNTKTQTVPIEEEKTCYCPLGHGFAVGCRDGKVYVILPPCSGSVKLCDEGIQVLVRFDADLFAFTASANYHLSPYDLNPREHPGLTAERGVIAAAVYQSSKEILLGFASGDVVLKTEFNSLTKEWSVHDMRFSSGLELNEGEQNAMEITCTEDASWFVVKYNSSSNPVVIVWRREVGTKLYQFSHDSTATIPIAIAPQTALQLPDYRISIIDSASLTFIKDESEWKDRCFFRLMLDSGIVWDVQSSVSKLDFIELKARGKHWATFRTLDFCVVFLPQDQYGHLEWINDELDEDEDTTNKVMRLYTDFAYEDFLVSDDGLYLCLIGQAEVKVLAVSAIESTFTHALPGGHTTMWCGHIRHHQFNTHFDEGGNPIVPLDKVRSGTVNFSEDQEFYEISRPNKWELYSRKGDQSIFGLELTVKKWVGNKKVVVIFKDQFQICDIEKPAEHKAIVSVDALGIENCDYFFWINDSDLFAFKTKVCGTHYTASGTSTTLSIKAEFEGVIAVHHSKTDFLLTYPKCTVYFSWVDQKVFQKDSVYTEIKPFAGGEFCAAVADNSAYVLSLPEMKEVLKFRWSDTLAVNPDSKEFMSYCADPQDERFGIVKVWDLEVGLYTKTINTGLKTCAEMLAQVSDTGLNPLQNLSHRTEYQCPNSTVICNLWKFDLSKSASEPASDFDQVKFFGNESLAAYCYGLKRLSFILTSHKSQPISLDPHSCRSVVHPYNVNILHFLVELRSAGLILPAFRLSAKFLKSVYGTPISLCSLNEPELAECLDALLQGLVDLKELDSEEFLAALHQLSDSGDFEKVIKSQSANLGPFLESVLVPLPAEVIPVSITLRAAKLPKYYLQPNLIQPFRSPIPSFYHLLFHSIHTFRPSALICPIGLHLSMNKAEGAQLLLALRDSDPMRNILSQKVIECIAHRKWNTVRWRWVSLSIVYWTLLILIVCRIYDYGNQVIICAAILALNFFLCAVEAVQIWMNRMKYANDPWNFIDVVRIIFTFPFAVISLRIWLTFLVVSVSAMRGLTSFESIDSTRFLVKMILKVCRETIFFVVVFIYSNLCFGVLLRASEEDAEEVNFFESWRESFELSMGGFDNSESNSLKWMVFFVASVVNVIWMLNLLISILGTAYEKFKVQVKAEDIKTQFELVVEMEQLFSFRAPPPTLQYLFIFTAPVKHEESLTNDLTLFALRDEMNTRMAEMSERIDGMEARINRRLQEMLQAMKVAMVKQQLASHNTA